MPAFLTVEKAKEQKEFLDHYLELIENYNPDTIEKKIIFEYAHFGSALKVYELLSRVKLIDSYDFVLDVIKSEPIDELHEIIRKDYMMRTKHHMAKDKSST